MTRAPINRGFMGRSLAMQAVLVAASAMAIAASAETASPQSFIDGIYKHYLGKDSKGLPLSSEAEIRRYFAPPLSDVMVKDFAAAEKAGEVPTLGGDPFVDAQDWEISNLKTAVKATGANTAIATASFTMFMKPRTVTLSLITTPAGWRISDINWGAHGTLRALYKLKQDRPCVADVYVGSHGYTHVPVFLPSAACGPFEVVVTGGGRKIVKQIEATCGE